MSDTVIYAWREDQGDVWTGEWALDRKDVWVPAESAKYILAAPEALAASSEVAAMLREAEARGMDRAAFIAWDEEDETVNRTWENWGEHRNMVTAQTVQKEIAAAIRAEAAAIRSEATK